MFKANGDVSGIRVLVGTADKSDDLIWCLEKPLSKLVLLVENEDGDNKFNWMVRFPFEKPSFYVSRYYCNTLRGATC